MRQDFWWTRLDTLQVRTQGTARNMTTRKVTTPAPFLVFKVRCYRFLEQAPPDVQSLENFAVWDWNSSAPFLCFTCWPLHTRTLDMLPPAPS